MKIEKQGCNLSFGSSFETFRTQVAANTALAVQMQQRSKERWFSGMRTERIAGRWSAMATARDRAEGFRLQSAALARATRLRVREFDGAKALPEVRHHANRRQYGAAVAFLVAMIALAIGVGVYQAATEPLDSYVARAARYAGTTPALVVEVARNGELVGENPRVTAEFKQAGRLNEAEMSRTINAIGVYSALHPIQQWRLVEQVANGR